MNSKDICGSFTRNSHHNGLSLSTILYYGSLKNYKKMLIFSFYQPECIFSFDIWSVHSETTERIHYLLPKERSAGAKINE